MAFKLIASSVSDSKSQAELSLRQLASEGGAHTKIADVLSLDALKPEEDRLDINAAGPKSGNTALHVAVERSVVKNVIALLVYNPDIFSKNLAGKLACELTKDQKIKDMLLIKVHRVLSDAVKSGDNVALEKSLTYPGINLDKKNEDGETPLFTAARLNNLVAVQKLLAAGANPDITDRQGLTPLIATSSSEIHNAIEVKTRGVASGTQGNNVYQSGCLRFPHLHTYLSALSPSLVRSVLILGPGMMDPSSFPSLSGISAQLVEVMALFPGAQVTAVDRENLAGHLVFTQEKMNEYAQFLLRDGSNQGRLGYSAMTQAILKRTTNGIRGLASEGFPATLRLVHSSFETYDFSGQHDLIIATYSLMYAVESIRSDSTKTKSHQQASIDTLFKNIIRSATNRGRVCLDSGVLRTIFGSSSTERVNELLGILLNDLLNEGLTVTIDLLHTPPEVSQNQGGSFCKITRTDRPDVEVKTSTNHIVVLNIQKNE